MPRNARGGEGEEYPMVPLSHKRGSASLRPCILAHVAINMWTISGQMIEIDYRGYVCVPSMASVHLVRQICHAVRLAMTSQAESNVPVLGEKVEGVTDERGIAWVLPA